MAKTASNVAVERVGSKSVALGSRELPFPWQFSPSLNRWTQTLVALQFSPLVIPKGAHIESAFIHFTTHGDDVASGPGIPLDVEISAFASVSSAIRLNSSVSLAAHPRAQASVKWTSQPWRGVGVAGPDHASADIAVIVQELVHRSDWNSVGSITFVLSNGSNTPPFSHRALFSNGLTPVLFVTYTGEMICLAVLHADGTLQMNQQRQQQWSPL